MTKPATVPPTAAGELAKILRVNRKTITRWRRANVPLNSWAALAEWAADQRKLPNGFLARVLELRDDKAGVGETPPADAETLIGVTYNAVVDFLGIPGTSDPPAHRRHGKEE